MFIFKNRFCVSFGTVIHDGLAEIHALNEGHYRPCTSAQRGGVFEVRQRERIQGTFRISVRKS